jgi:hypothetical protein
LIRSRRVRLTILTAVAATAVAVAGYAFAPAASADVGGSFATTANASDPFVVRCFDPSTGQSGLCMYTSQDMGITTNLPPDNSYPMQNTLGFFSADNGRSWAAKGAILSESQIPWVPANPSNPSQLALHLWAPAAITDPSSGYTTLLVPDVQDANKPGVHTSSKIALEFGFSPFGPFEFLGTVNDGHNTEGYMSDPEPFSDNTGQYLVWANGDGDTCGDLSVANFSGSNISGAQEISITGFPSWGTCTRKSPFSGTVSHPYIEGPSLFKFSDSAGDLSGLPGPYTLVFAVKSSGNTVPTECSHFGQPNSGFEAIAYATSSSVRGPYAYQGIMMCGSEHEWTNQATITEVTMANGAKRMVMIYHDALPGTSVPPHNRKLHAECLWYGAGTFALATRNATGFNDCMNGADTNVWAFRSHAFGAEGVWSTQPTDATGNGRIYANRAAVGPWEKFDVRDANNNLLSPTMPGTITWDTSMLAHANGRIVTSEGTGTGALIANRTAVGAWEKFILVTGGWTGTAAFTNEASGLEVTSQQSHVLKPTNPARAPDEQFDILHL